MLSILPTISLDKSAVITVQEKFCYCCDNCKEIPQFKFEHKDPFDETIEIKCKCNNPQSIISLKDYLPKFKEMYKKRNNCQGIEKHLYTPSLEFCTHCSYWLCPTCINEEKKDAIRYNNEIVVPFCRIHRRSYRYYCYNCSCNICEECAMDHTNHSYQALAVMVTENELGKIKNHLSEAKKVSESYEIILKKAKKELFDKITVIENEIKKIKETNLRIYSFISTIYDNYNEAISSFPHYNAILNLKLIPSISLQKIEFNSNTFSITLLPSIRTIKLNESILSTTNTSISTNSSVLHNKEIIKEKEIIFSKEGNKIFTLHQYGNSMLTSIGEEITLINNNNTTTYFKTQDTVLYVTTLNNNKIACLSNGKIMIKNDVNNYFLPGHTQMVFKAIVLNKTQFASCSLDHQVIIWEENNNLYQQNYSEKFDSPVISLHLLNALQNKMLCATTHKNKVYLYDFKTHNIDYIFNHIDCCYSNSICEKDNKIYIGGKGSLSIIKLNSFEEIEHLPILKKTSMINVITSIDNYLICGLSNGNLVLYDTKIKKILHKVSKAHSKGISAIVKETNSSFVSSSFDGTIKRWEINYSI